jgi:hypothetical protein
MISRLLFVTALLLLPAVAGTIEMPPGEAFTSPLGFPMGKTTLLGIQARLGPAPLERSGDAGESAARICYRVPEHGVVVEFLSGALGGPRHDFLGFRMRSVSDTSTSKCATTARTTSADDLSVGGLRLNMARSAFEQILGVRGDSTKRTIERQFERRQRLTPTQIERAAKQWPQITQDPFSAVLIVVKGTFAAGRLVELEVWKTETL